LKKKNLAKVFQIPYQSIIWWSPTREYPIFLLR